MIWTKNVKRSYNHALTLFGAFVFLCAFAAELSSGADAVSEKNIPAASVLIPLPAPVQPPNLVPLSTGEQLGKDIFYDETLSNPAGYSCANCHNPQTGFTGPSSSLNLVAGPVPGVVPGRFGRRNPQPIPYAVFSPRGPFLSGLEGGTYVGGTFWDGRTPDIATQARMPFLDPNEMANAPAGTLLTVAMRTPAEGFEMGP